MNINEYYDEIRNDIAHEFGLEAAGYKPIKYPLSVAQCQTLLHKYGFDKAMIISKRYASLTRVI